MKFKGLELVPTVGGQQINGTLQGQFQAQSNLDTKDLMQFSIEARVVDIRPNGHLVLEGHQTMINNEERWRPRISGIVRPEDVLPNNTILSEKVAELSIDKSERGWRATVIAAVGCSTCSTALECFNDTQSSSSALKNRSSAARRYRACVLAIALSRLAPASRPSRGRC